MTRPWETLEAADTPAGRLELRRRGEREYVITIGGRVLMNSAAHRTEAAAAELACGRLGDRPKPRVLIGGLGMGFTLRAALDALPRSARVVVAEIDPKIVAWCRGPLAELTGRAAADPRVRIEIADVASVITRAAREGEKGRFDAIILDLYEGPRAAHGGGDAPLYGRQALERTRSALAPDGVLAVWSEDADAAFEKRLRAAGFAVEVQRPGKGGPRHVVYLAQGRGGRSQAAGGAQTRPSGSDSCAPSSPGSAAARRPAVRPRDAAGPSPRTPRTPGRR
jgi:spermidine synthase